MKEIEDNTNRWKGILCSWIRRIHMLKWAYYPRQSTDSMQSLSKQQRHFFHRTRTSNFKIFIATQKILNSQNHIEKEQSWRYHAPWLQTILQSYSSQNSMVLSQKLTHRLMEQNRKSRNKPKHLSSINLQRRQEYTMEKRQSLQQMVLEKLDSHM